MEKGQIGPTELAGLFITLLLVAALTPLINEFVSGIASAAGTPASTMITFFPVILAAAIFTTVWRYGS